MRWRTDSLLRRNTLPKSAVCKYNHCYCSDLFVFRLCPVDAGKRINARCNRQSFCSLYLLCGLYKTSSLLEIKAYSKCWIKKPTFALKHDLISIMECSYWLCLWFKARRLYFSHLFIEYYNIRVACTFHATITAWYVSKRIASHALPDLLCVCFNSTLDRAISWQAHLVPNQQLRADSSRNQTGPPQSSSVSCCP